MKTIKQITSIYFENIIKKEQLIFKWENRKIFNFSNILGQG